MKNFLTLLMLSATMTFWSCSKSNDAVEVMITNHLDAKRLSETVEIELSQLSQLLAKFTPEELIVKKKNSGDVVLSQLIDLDEDKKSDQLIFQVDINAKETLTYVIEGSKGEVTLPENKKSTFARFVPERIDDFAWENDKVAFRTYGPTAQAITESGKPGGTLSSGIDCWLKKVEYPIINKWYKEDLEQGKSYHEDHGEGLDNYHVGPSRGTGGVGVWKDGKLITSKNYQSWKIIANGPIRTVFELDYGTWDADSIPVKEIKRIQIDLGSNLYKSTLLLEYHEQLPNITIGVTLHEKSGEVNTDQDHGWFRYWEPHDGSELSTAIVVDPTQIIEFIDHRVEEKDQSNLLVVCKPASQVEYYAGFAWKESNQFELPGGFDNYLHNFAHNLESPLEIIIK